VFACAPLSTPRSGSLIEVVNRFGSYSAARFWACSSWRSAPSANGHSAFVGLIGGMTAVGLIATFTRIEFLWLNVVGAVAVTAIGLAVTRSRTAR
jgi:hypothetical protein